MSIPNYLVRFPHRGQEVTAIVVRETADIQTLWLVLDSTYTTYYRRPLDCEVVGYSNGIQRLAGDDRVQHVALKTLMKSRAGKEAALEAQLSREPDRAAPVRIVYVQRDIEPGSGKGEAPDPGGPPPDYVVPMKLSTFDAELTNPLTAYLGRNEEVEDDGTPRKWRSLERKLDILKVRNPRYYEVYLRACHQQMPARAIREMYSLRSEAYARVLKRRAQQALEGIADTDDPAELSGGGSFATVTAA